MNAPVTPARGGVLQRLFGARIRVAFLLCTVGFAWAVGQFYQPTTGFTSLLMIGDAMEANQVTRLREVPHYRYKDSVGYDGAYYVQLALYPSLDNPELSQAIDNLPYRARRMLFGWVAWLLGLGQPAWIVQAQALLNVLCWFALAWLLTRWFPPTTGENFLRWAGILFSHGVCMSARDSLVDGPALLFVALAMAWIEDGRRGRAVAMLALGGLGKETSLLAAAGLADGLFPPSRRAWCRLAGLGLVVALPLAAWIGYVRWKFGPVADPGFGNFTLPLIGLAEKWGAALSDLADDSRSFMIWATLLAVLGVTVQMIFFLARWRPRELWWRVGASFAVMAVFLAKPVWEGYPGAFTRVLLPMALAFNLLVPRGRAWLPVLIAGNLSVLAGFNEFSPPAREFFQVHGDSAIVAKLQVRADGWHGLENAGGRRWRWSAGSSVLVVRNQSDRAVALTFSGKLRGERAGRALRIAIGAQTLWSGTLTEDRLEVGFGCVVPPGETTLAFTSDRPPNSIGVDPRLLAFSLTNLEIVVAPVSDQR